MKNDAEVVKIARIKDLLYAWVAVVDNRKFGGYPKQSAFAVERVQNDNIETDSFHVGTHPDIIKLDEEVAKLAPMFQQVLRLEYFDKRPTKTKAAVLGIPRQVFAQRISFMHQQLSFAIYGE